MSTLPESLSGGQSTQQTIRLGNRDFQLERARVPLAFLKLDPSNQRLSYLIGKQGGNADDAEVEELLWQMDPVKDLYNSIYQNGGLISDPIVRRDGVVVEGNCRTVCLRRLRQRFSDDARWKEVFVQILPDEATDEQLTMLIGELHIAGKIEWRAFEQAEYVWKMNEKFGKTIDFLASHLRWSRSKVEQKIAAYQETKVYLEESQDPEAIGRFSHFEEFMKKKELRDRRKDDPDFMRQFRRWVHEGKFGDAKDVRDLPGILENERAHSTFVHGGLVAAQAILHSANPALISNFWATMDRAASELRNVPLIELEDLRRGQRQKVAKLRELQAALTSLAEHAEIKLKS